MTGRRRLISIGGLAAMAALIAFLLLEAQRGSPSPTGAIVEAGGPGFDAIRADEIQTILPEDAIPALIHPRYLSAGAATDIRESELILGVAINGDARAYPLATLSAHEIVDDDIGGSSIAVTW